MKSVLSGKPKSNALQIVTQGAEFAAKAEQPAQLVGEQPPKPLPLLRMRFRHTIE